MRWMVSVMNELFELESNVAAAIEVAHFLGLVALLFFAKYAAESLVEFFEGSKEPRDENR